MPTVGLTAGFLPLFDSALLVLAHEKGFAETEGLALRLIRETSWANIRDRSELGHFDLAVMLAPMPIAANLGLTVQAANVTGRPNAVIQFSFAAAVLLVAGRGVWHRGGDLAGRHHRLCLRTHGHQPPRGLPDLVFFVGRSFRQYSDR